MNFLFQFLYTSFDMFWSDCFGYERIVAATGDGS